MVMPLYDHSPFRWPTPPYVTWLLIAINGFVFLLQVLAGTQSEEIDRAAALIPAAFTGEVSLAPALPGPATLVSYTFLHGNFWHLFGNMIFLWVFGDDIEEAIGHGRFLIFYVACGIAAGLAFVVSDPGSRMELIGASGAVAGVLAAYLIFRPCAHVTVLIFMVPARIKAYWIIGGWVVWQVFELASHAHDGVAYWAHIGGLTAGVLLFVLMRPPGVRLFQCVEPETLPAAGASDAL